MSETKDLTGRTAKCHCGNTAPSDEGLPFNPDICTKGHYFAYHDRFHWARNFEAVKLLLARKGIL